MQRAVYVMALAGLLAGCLTVEKAKLPGGEPGGHIMVRNYGKYLFNCVPMGCGNAKMDAACGFVMFRDDVTLDKMNQRFIAECHKHGTEISDVACHTEEDVFIRLPIWSFDIPIPYIWTHHEIQISGVIK